MEIVSPEQRFALRRRRRLPADALVGDENAGIAQLFAGLSPERIMAAAFATGIGRFALDKATEYVKGREVFGPRSARTRASRTRSRSPRSRSSWPG